ncbi:MAG: adenine phosphoribosyltransferase [Chloroflexi bacterium]|nr:adenine phosphoribosyltransferase [Chloroflexota bacterium]|tara:strand:- start:3317 stop:3829 length:513 start_codon:yes stop_codon:yes gene_type:complete
MRFEQLIREVKDFPKPGINFRDITPVLQNPTGFKEIIDSFTERYQGQNIQGIAGIESRGFLIAAPLAKELELPLLLIRKKGKLPFKTKSITYDLEYGTDSLEIHIDSAAKSDRIVLIDDLLATGGTLAAAAKLIENLGATVVELGVIIELVELNGRNKLNHLPVHSLCQV